MCIFCDLLQKEDDPSFILKLNGGTLFVNHSQTYLGRVMYVCNKHLKDVSYLKRYEDDFWAKQFSNDRIMISKTLKCTFGCNRIDEASLGNEVPHLHYHLIPRYMQEPNFLKAPWPHKKKIISEDEQIKMAELLKNVFYKMWPNYKFESIKTV